MSKHHHEDEEDLLKMLVVLACDQKELAQRNNRENAVLIHQNQRILRVLYKIAHEVEPPFLNSIQLMEGTPMPTPGPIQITSAGQTVATVVVGLDQNGQPFNGPIPTGTYTDDNPTVAKTDANGVVTGLSSGTDNATVNLTTAEGLALTASIQVIVNIAAAQVLTSIQLQQA